LKCGIFPAETQSEVFTPSVEKVYSEIKKVANNCYPSIYQSWSYKMFTMDESTLLAHALRDFLRVQLTDSDVRLMDNALQAGESVSALGAGLSIAAQRSVALPPIFAEKILHLENLSAEDLKDFTTDFTHIPLWLQLAS
jgi:hypothetical protein